MRLYGVLGKEWRKCEYGDEHLVYIHAIKNVTKVGTWEHNNGYETNTAGVYVDAQGRTYKQYITIDYTGNVYYVRDNDNVFFYSTSRRPGIDILGNRLGGS